MAPTNRRRRRKHRDTQAGTIERAGRTGRPQARHASKAPAKPSARERREARLDRPPTWRGSLNRALIGAVIVAIVFAVTSKRPLAAVPAGILVLLVYIPITYYMDRAIYRRRQRRKRTGG